MGYRKFQCHPLTGFKGQKKPLHGGVMNMESYKVILDHKILKAFERIYGLKFDTKYSYCTFDNGIVKKMRYKGEDYKLRYVDGCFYPYLYKIEYKTP